MLVTIRSECSDSLWRNSGLRDYGVPGLVNGPKPESAANTLCAILIDVLLFFS